MSTGPGRTHLLLAPVSGAMGELATGIRLAWQLHARGDRVLFLASAVHAPHLAGTPFAHGRIDGLLDQLPQLLPAVVAEKRADDVILVDLTSALLTCVVRRLDVSFLGRLNVPVIGLDLWSLGETSMVLDAVGGDIVLPRAALDLVPRRLVAVPYARPDAPGACGFWPAGDPVDRAAARAAWAGSSERLVVLATSAWQTHILPATPIMAGVAPQLVSVLAGLPDGLLVIHVGPAPLPGHEALGARYRHVAPLPAPEFRRLVAAADVFVTLNQLAASAVVALDVGVPALAVIGRDPPFRAWPAGFHRFFGEVLERNPFGELVRAVAVEDAGELADALWFPRADAAAVAAYQDRVAALPVAAALLDRWL